MYSQYFISVICHLLFYNPYIWNIGKYLKICFLVSCLSQIYAKNEVLVNKKYFIVIWYVLIYSMYTIRSLWSFLPFLLLHVFCIICLSVCQSIYAIHVDQFINSVWKVRSNYKAIKKNYVCFLLPDRPCLKPSYPRLFSSPGRMSGELLSYPRRRRRRRRARAQKL